MSNENNERLVVTVPDMTINNIAVKYTPESLKFTHGLGTDKMRNQSIGGGAVETTFARDITEAYGTCKFEIVPTVANIERVRDWKSRFNNNSITLSDSTTGWSKKFSHAALVNDPEISLSSTANIECEFQSDQPQ